MAQFFTKKFRFAEHPRVVRHPQKRSAKFIPSASELREENKHLKEQCRDYELELQEQQNEMDIVKRKCEDILRKKEASDKELRVANGEAEQLDKYLTQLEDENAQLRKKVKNKDELKSELVSVTEELIRYKLGAVEHAIIKTEKLESSSDNESEEGYLEECEMKLKLPTQFVAIKQNAELEEKNEIIKKLRHDAKALLSQQGALTKQQRQTISECQQQMKEAEQRFQNEKLQLEQKIKETEQIVENQKIQFQQRIDEAQETAKNQKILADQKVKKMEQRLQDQMLDFEEKVKEMENHQLQLEHEMTAQGTRFESEKHTLEQNIQQKEATIANLALEKACFVDFSNWLKHASKFEEQWTQAGHDKWSEDLIVLKGHLSKKFQVSEMVTELLKTAVPNFMQDANKAQAETQAQNATLPCDTTAESIATADLPVQSNPQKRRRTQKEKQKRVFRCQVCCNGFTSLGHLRRHLADVHGLPNVIAKAAYGCKTCGGIFEAKDKAIYDEHRKRCTPDQPNAPVVPKMEPFDIIVD